MRRNVVQFSEDDIQAKIYDSDLFKKLARYLKPYLFYVAISFVMLIFITASELARPAITKYAVDEFITANIDMIAFKDEASRARFIQKYDKIKFTTYNSSGNYFVTFSNNKTNYISSEELQKFKSAEQFFNKVVLIENTAENRELLEGYEYENVSSELLAIPSSKLYRLKDDGVLDKEQLRKLQTRNIHKLRTFGVILFGIIILQFLAYYLQIYMINYASQHAMFDLRKSVFAHVSKMPLTFFDKNPIGRLVTRVTNDVRTLDEMFSNGLIQLLQEFFVLTGIVVMMLIFNWQLALVTFTVLPVVAVLFIIFMRKSRKIYREVRKRVAQINATLAEDIAGVKIIQLFNQFTRKCKEFYKINLEYYNTSITQMKLFAFFRPLINSMRRVALAIILWYGGSRILDNMISLGLFIAFVSYLDRFFEPINRLSEKFNIMQAAMAGTERIFDLMDKKPEDYKVENCDLKTELQGDIEFQNVWLAYNEDEYVLKDISFHIKQGEKVALVGHTGSGKTSVISLLAGLYPHQKGKILLDGVSLKDYCLEDIRNNIGIVQQDVFLFSGTIKENIILNNQNISEEEIKRVSKYVNVAKFIESLPQQYEEPVMERGSTFSVGQRQLIAFARVLAYDPAIFVLDEATSNIDTETELLIQDALKKVMANRTSIIIAHRLSTIQHVDRIIVLHKGRIEEEGSHQELLRKGGLYYHLYKLQYE